MFGKCKTVVKNDFILHYFVNILTEFSVNFVNFSKIFSKKWVLFRALRLEKNAAARRWARSRGANHRREPLNVSAPLGPKM